MVLEELRGQFELFKATPFPQDSPDTELSELHAALAEYDAYIAGQVETLLSRKTPMQIAYDANLEERIRGVLKAKAGGDLRLCNQYLRYMGVMKRLVEIAASYWNNGGPNKPT